MKINIFTFTRKNLKNNNLIETSVSNLQVKFHPDTTAIKLPLKIKWQQSKKTGQQSS